MRRQLLRRQFLDYHDDQGQVTRRLPTPLPVADPHTDHVGLGEEIVLVGAFDRADSLGGSLEVARILEGLVCGVQIVTCKPSSTAWIGLKMVVWFEPANSRPTAFKESPATTSEPESPPWDIGPLTSWPSKRATRLEP